MRKVMSLSNFTTYILIAIGFIISFFATKIFPERFFLDANIILTNPNNYFNGFIGSYPFSIWFYRVTGLGALPYGIIGVIQYIIMISILLKIGLVNHLHRLTGKSIIIYLMILILAVYVSVPSKEFINFICLSPIVFLIKKRQKSFKKTLFFSLVVLLIIGFIFRPYYLLVALLAIFMQLLSNINIRNHRTATIFYGISLVIIVSLSMGVIKGYYISNSTRGYMVSRGVSNSAIVSPVKANVWYGEIISIVHGFFSVNFPVNGLQHFLSPHIIIFVFWQILLFIVLVKQFDKIVKEGKRKNYDLLLCHILFSYFIVQAVFEPDLGSALRHKASVFPLIYYLLNYDLFRRK